METQSVLKSKTSKILLGMTLVFAAVMVAQFGFMFGQWLQHVIN